MILATKNFQTANKSSTKFRLKNSFAAFIDILGFSDAFSKDPNSCIELLKIFASYNGVSFNRKKIDTLKIRPAVTCFSDNVGLSIPVNLDKNSYLNDFYAPLMSFLYGISLFAYEALLRGFYIRGAISYGKVYHTKTVIAGDPFIEASKYEKNEAKDPKIILTPTALTELEKFNKIQSFAKSREMYKVELQIINDKNDNSMYFDWLSFYIGAPKTDGPSDTEINSTIGNSILELEKEIITLEEKIRDEKDLPALDKLLEVEKKILWMKKYLNKRHTDNSVLDQINATFDSAPSQL